MIARSDNAYLALSAVLIFPVAAVGEVEQPPEPQPEVLRLQPWSARNHELLLSRLAIADQWSYTRLLSAYDDYLERYPDDVETAVERCRFIEKARYDEEIYDYNPNYEAFEDCLAKLTEKFPDERAVILATLENTWGEEAIERARALVEEGLEEWPAAEAARVYQHLATQLEHHGDPSEAASAAYEAMQRDPSLDLTLTVARYWQEKGNAENALLALRNYIDAPAETWELSQKAALLVDIGAYDLAVRVYGKLENDPDAQPDPLGYARALEGAGDILRARNRYADAAGEYWDPPEARRRLFLFDLEHRDGWAAAGSYNLFRDTGFGADPILRYRLDLALKHPSAPWRWRDAWGAALLVGIALCVAALPSLWILPVHYFGLIRRARHPELQNERSRWGLGHCWYVSAWIIFVQCIAIFWFYYDGFGELFEGTLALTAGDAQKLAQMALITIALTILGLLPLLRGSDYRLLIRTQWSAKRTLLVVMGALAVLWITLALPLYSLTREMAKADQALAIAFPFAATVTMKIIDAVGTTYGLAVQLGFLALLAPVYEELVFRGIVLQGCQRYLSFAWANLVQAALFTVGHESVAYYPLYLSIALVAGTLAKRSGGLAAPVLLHVSNNAAALWLIRIWGSSA